MSDDQDVKPLVIDTSAACGGSSAVLASESTDVGDMDASEADGELGASQSCSGLPLVVPSVDGSEAFSEEDEGADDDYLSTRHQDESVSSDSLSTVGSASKDLTGSLSAGDLSPGGGVAVRCSKSRRKTDRVSRLRGRKMHIVWFRDCYC